MKVLALDRAALARASACRGTARASRCAATTSSSTAPASLSTTRGTSPAPWELADELEPNHFTWIAFHVNNGIAQQDPPRWLEVLRAHGISVGGWG